MTITYCVHELTKLLLNYVGREHIQEILLVRNSKRIRVHVRTLEMSESDDASDVDFMESKRSVLIYTNFRTLINIYCILHSDSSPTQQFKPMDITFMNKRLKMKFYVKDKKGMSIFLGRLYHMGV